VTIDLYVKQNQNQKGCFLRIDQREKNYCLIFRILFWWRSSNLWRGLIMTYRRPRHQY